MGKILTRPLLGFNSYDCWGPDMNEERALANIEAFAQKLQPFGYEYFCFDAGWFLDLYYMERLNNPEAEKIKNLDEFGRLNPSKVKFPRGFKPITDACHSRGFKFGLHFMRGIPKLAVERRCRIKGTNYFAADIADVDNDCAWGSENYGVDMSKPGAQEYYDSILEFLAENGVDFIKVDDMAEHPLEIAAVARAIEHCGRPMVLSLSPGDNVFRGNMPEIRQYADMLRISGDVWDRAWDLQKVFDRWEMWEDYGSQECFIDLDMIPFGLLQGYIPEGLPKDHVPHDLNEKRLSRLTLEEKRTFMTQRAMAASPLIFGGDLTLSPAEDIALTTNTQMLECNQLGVTAKRIYGQRHLDVRQLFTPGSNNRHGFVAVFNRKGAAYNTTLPLTALKLPEGVDANNLRDIWTERSLNLKDGIIKFNFKPWECFFTAF